MRRAWLTRSGSPRKQAAAARQAVRQCTTGLRPLDSFFPFDPYLLARSAVPLVPCDAYIRWGQSATLAADGAAGSLNGGDDDDEEDMVRWVGWGRR
jgi:hypothetical protein